VQSEKEEARQNDGAVSAKKYADAIRGSIVPIELNPIDAVAFFQRAEKLFVSYGVPKELQANLIGPYLNQKAKQIWARLSPEVTSVYDNVKETILREIKLSAAAYLQRFNTCAKTDDETYVSYASKLRGLLVYYLNSRRVTTFKNLKELILCDRVKSTLSDNCLKHILSVDSSRDRGWLPIKELTESVDRFVAAKGDSFKHRPLRLVKPQRRCLSTARLELPVASRRKQMPPHQSPVAQRVDRIYSRVMPRHLSRLFAIIAKRLGTFLGTALSRKSQAGPRGPALSKWQC